MEDTWLDRNRNLVFAIIALVAAGGAAIFYIGQPTAEPIAIAPVEETSTPEATAEPTATPLPTETPTPAPVRVYITGAVVNSDVYFLPAGSIIKDVIEAAGGFTTNASSEQVNQALEVKDQQQIHIPSINEENPPPPIQGGVDNTPAQKTETSNEQNTESIAPGAGGLINLNVATLDQLDTLPGIGPAIAQRIIDYRENTGRFKSIEEIKEVSGIGKSTFTKIQPFIVVE